VKCAGTKRNGDRCGANAIKGTDRCISHSDEETKKNAGFGGPQEGAGRPAQIKPTEALNQAFLEAAREHRDKIIGAYIEGLEADKSLVVGNGPSAHVASVPDIPTRITAAEKLTDRVVGKPRQSVEHSGPDGGPISTSHDLSGLSAQELRVLRALLEKAADA
jgi:hypothetical protein